MKLLVNENKVILDEKDKLNAGEYNIHQVEFVFSEEYNGLVKKATFSTKEHSYLVDLPNGTCIIPYEVLEETGDFEIGAFGYETDGDELLLRYSPSPTYVHVDLGSYRDSFDNYKVPTADVIEQLTERIENAEETVEGYDDRLTTAENKLETIEEGAEVNIIEDVKVNNTSLEVVNKSVNIPVPTKTSDLSNDSGYITNTVDDLTNYTKTGDMNTAINNAVNEEKELRQQADTNLQTQIDAITSSTDVVDVVGTYQELLDYDTSKLTDKDVIKVLQDSTHNNALSYFRWIINTTGSWNYVGSEGPFYTKGETDTLLNTKQDTIDSSHKLSADYVDDSLTTNKFTNTSEKSTWNAKYNKPSGGIPKTDLSSSVQTSLNKADTAIQDVSDKEDKSNKVTSVSSSSTDTQYPSAKLLYEEKTALEVENNKLKGVINNIYDLENYLFEEQSTHQETDQDITLNNTMKNAPMKTILKGNTSQTGTPTPSTPIPISVVSGDNEVVVCGKNILDTSNVTSAGWNIYGIPNTLKPNTKYTFSIQGTTSFNYALFTTSGTDSSTTITRLASYQSAGNSVTFTTPADMSNELGLLLGGSATGAGNESIDVIKPQIELGETKTDYEPYQSQTYPINLGTLELCKIGDYQDYFYKTDKWYLHKEIEKIILDETKSYQYSSGYGAVFYTDTDVANVNNRSITIMSNKAVGIPIINLENNNGIAQNSAANRFLIKFDGVTSLTTDALAKAYFGSNNYEVRYIKSSPTNIEITDNTLINQLDNIQNALSYEGQTNVSQVNNDKPIIIDITAIQKL